MGSLLVFIRFGFIFITLYKYSTVSANHTFFKPSNKHCVSSRWTVWIEMTIKNIHINVIIFASNIIDSYAYCMSAVLWKNGIDSPAPTTDKQASHPASKEEMGTLGSPTGRGVY